nr:replication protein [Mute swan feces associated circular virus 3]
MESKKTTKTTNAEGNTRTSAMKRVQSRKWCFTLNNWNPKEKTTLLQTFTKKAKYYVIGEEVGEKGTPHLQGYVEFKNPVALTTMKRINTRMHLEKGKGSREENLEYCSKDGKAITNIPLSREKQILKKKYGNVTWRPWQVKVIEISKTEPNDRTIHWIVDIDGNSGKSFLAQYLCLTDKVIIADGKKADIFNQLKTWMDDHEYESPRIILCDVPRYNIGFVNYGLLEQLKNGFVYSGKYEGGVCHFESPHVFVFANSYPDEDNWTKDRIEIIELS